MEVRKRASDREKSKRTRKREIERSREKLEGAYSAREPYREEEDKQHFI